MGPSTNSNPPQGVGVSSSMWPSYTDLVFGPGSRKVTLMLQHAPLCDILHAAFENICVYLLFNDSFPNVATLPLVIRDCLISAATESQDPQALGIHERLNSDVIYIQKLSHLVRTFTYIIIYRLTDIVLAAARSHLNLPL